MPVKEEEAVGISMGAHLAGVKPALPLQKDPGVRQGSESSMLLAGHRDGWKGRGVAPFSEQRHLGCSGPRRDTGVGASG